MTGTEGLRPELPRYHRLSNTLTERISRGAYAVGDLLPTEVELCEEFEVSRYTVREALRRLTEAGLVRRRQGSGSQVVASKAPANYSHSMRSLSELFQYAVDTVLRIDSMAQSVPEPGYAKHFGSEAEEPWLFVEGVRLAPEATAPICFSKVFINRAFASIADELPNLEGAIYGLIEERFGVTVDDVEQEITAEPMAKLAARRLGVSTKMWSVCVVRRYFGADRRLLVVSVNYHPGDSFSYTMHLRREGQKGWT